MRLSFLIFNEIAKLNSCVMFCNHQIAKLNFFFNCEIKFLQNLMNSLLQSLLIRCFTIGFSLENFLEKFIQPERDF